METGIVVIVGLLLLGSILAGVIHLSVGKLADKVADAIRNAPPPPAPILQMPNAPASSGGRGPVIVRWEEEEIEFSPNDAANIISELISDVFKDLTGQDKALLKSIYRSHKAGQLHRLPEDFRRGSQEHQYYRRLRDSHLIRPVEGKFLPAVRIEMTDFGLAVIQRFPSLLESDDTGVGMPAIVAAG